MKNKSAFTLVEVLVVVAILVLVGALTMPGISAMNAASAHANAKNTINAALQGVRSYAIMNNVKAAARFQPNGKISFVYKFTGNATAEARRINDTDIDPYPDATNPISGYVYLPVIDQEPLQLPASYSVADSSHLASLLTTDAVNDSKFWEPFYVCYNPDGTMAVGENIWVALVDNGNQPVNPDFNEDGHYAWDDAQFPSSYTNVKNFMDGFVNTTDGKIPDDVDDNKLTRYFYVAEDYSDLEDIFTADENAGIDHYAGLDLSPSSPLSPTHSITQFCLFKTPAGWSQLPLFIDDTTTATKTKYVAEEFTRVGKSAGFEPNPDKYETIFLNPYTGRVIKPIE